MSFTVPINPYSGITASQVTSNILDLRDAFDWSLSVYTSAGTASAWTLQLSNQDAAINAVTAASFQNYMGASAATLIPSRTGVCWGRIIRNPSNCSWVFDFAKYVAG